MKKIISVKNAPAAVGAYSQAIATDNMIFISGQLPIDPSNGQLRNGTITDQTKQSMDNIGEILAGAGTSWNNVVKTTILLKNINDFAEVNEAYKVYFNNGFPARSCYQVAELPKGANIEIEAIAII